MKDLNGGIIPLFVNIVVMIAVSLVTSAAAVKSKVEKHA